MSNERLKSVGRRIGDTSDLPDELKAQLPRAALGEVERDIMSIIEKRYEGVASVDEILVGIYREFGRVEQRQKLVGRLYRMNQAGQIYAMPKRKGIYATDKSLISQENLDPINS